jgi:UDP-glucose 4-epimerase
MARVIVTGGAGFIGSNLVDALLARGDEVVVIDDLSSGKESNLEAALGHGARLHVEDVRDAGAIQGLFERERPDVVFHLAAQVDVRISVDRPAYDLRTNVEGTLNLLEAARLAESRRFVLASTGGGIYGEVDEIPTPETVAPQPMAPYGQSKFCAERYLGLYERLYGVSTVALRFGNVYGPRQDPHGEAGVIAIFCGRLLDGQQPVVFGDGRQTRDYIYVGDLVEGMLRAAEADVRGEINIGTEVQTDVLELIEALRDAASEDEAQGFEPEFRPARLGEIQDSGLAVAKAREVLGWSAGTGVREGIAQTLAWARAARG